MTTTKTPIATGWIRSFAVWHYSPEIETNYEVARLLCKPARVMQYEEGQGPCDSFAALQEHTWQANVCTDCLVLATGGTLGKKSA